MLIFSLIPELMLAVATLQAQVSAAPALAAIANPPENFAGFIPFKSAQSTRGILTTYGANPGVITTTVARPSIDKRFVCGENNPIECDAVRNLAVVSTCQDLAADLTDHGISVLEPGTRSICLKQANWRCCVSWTDDADRTLTQGALVNGMVSAVGACAPPPAWSVSARVANIMLGKTCTTQCLSNRPSDCTPLNIFTRDVKNSNGHDSPIALTSEPSNAPVYPGLKLLQSSRTADGALRVVYGDDIQAQATQHKLTTRSHLKCGDNAPVSCSLENIALSEICRNLLNDLIVNGKHGLPAQPRSICRVEGDERCCTSWADDVAGMTENDLVPGVQKSLETCGPFDRISSRVANVKLGKSKTCTTQCLSNRPNDCVNGGVAEFQQKRSEVGASNILNANEHKPVIQGYDGMIALSSITSKDGAVLTFYGADPAASSRGTSEQTKSSEKSTEIGDLLLDKRRTCGDNAPVVCDNKNESPKWICQRLLNDLISNTQLDLNVLGICYKVGKDKCCTSIPWDIPGLKQGHLINALSAAIDQCPGDQVSARVGNVLINGRCSVQCVSDRPDSCSDMNMPMKKRDVECETYACAPGAFVFCYSQKAAGDCDSDGCAGPRTALAPGKICEQDRVLG